MQIETWDKVWCDSCGAVNWVYSGDQSDSTGMDMDGFQCHQCQKIHSFDDEFDANETGSFDVGLERPTK